MTTSTKSGMRSKTIRIKNICLVPDSGEENINEQQYVKNMKEVPAKNELQCGNCYSLGEIDDAVRAANDM